MSVPILDQSDYLRDMEELDDLMPHTAISDTLSDVTTYEVAEDTEHESVPAAAAKPATCPKTAEDFIPSHLIKSRLEDVPAKDPPGSTADGWGDKPKATGSSADPVKPASKSWFGSGGKAPESEDELKKGLLTRIDAYRASWPWLDDKITFPPNLHKKTPEKLKAILEECSNKVQNRNMTSMLGIVFSTAICGIENLCTKQFGWTDLKGFALECETDEAIKNSIKEIEIKYFACSKAMAPEARLAIALLQKLVAVTNRNRSQRLLEEVARRPLDDLALQGFDDL